MEPDRDMLADEFAKAMRKLCGGAFQAGAFIKSGHAVPPKLLAEVRELHAAAREKVVQFHEANGTNAEEWLQRLEDATDGIPRDHLLDAIMNPPVQFADPLAGRRRGPRRVQR